MLNNLHVHTFTSELNRCTEVLDRLYLLRACRTHTSTLIGKTLFFLGVLFNEDDLQMARNQLQWVAAWSPGHTARQGERGDVRRAAGSRVGWAGFAGRGRARGTAPEASASPEAESSGTSSGFKSRVCDDLGGDRAAFSRSCAKTSTRF